MMEDGFEILSQFNVDEVHRMTLNRDKYVYLQRIV